MNLLYFLELDFSTISKLLVVFFYNFFLEKNITHAFRKVFLC